MVTEVPDNVVTQVWDCVEHVVIKVRDLAL